MNTVLIEEPFIVNAFLDLFDSIPDSDLIFSKEDTIKVIKDAIKKLEA